MNKKEFATGIFMLENAYGSFRISDDPWKMDVWYDLLDDLSLDTYINNIKEHIKSSTYVPTIASLRRVAAEPEMSGIEAWGYLYKGLANSLYYAEEEWEKLPEAVKNLVTPELMREWAQMEITSVQTVVQSNFLRSYRERQGRKSAQERLETKVKEHESLFGDALDHMGLEQTREQDNERGRLA